MRIYSFNLNIKILPIEELNKYLHHEYKTIYFNTNEGKVEILNNKIYKYMDSAPKTICNISDDLSVYTQMNEDVKKEIQYVPINYLYNKNIVRKYKLNSNSLLTMITENNNTFYFETDETEITLSVKEDMNTFLSILKLYN